MRCAVFTACGPGWPLTSFGFLATAASTTLTFQSLTGTGYGPVIDNVRVSSVPEPSTGLMLGCGLLGLTSARLRRFAKRM